MAAQKPPYNIPSAWSPGLAVPDYIRREGLERHAFVTLEAPDGTYDDPPVGSGGYVVPQYVLDEGYGRGAAITTWAPRGTYYGPRIPSFLSHPSNKIVATSVAPNGWKQYTIASGVPQPAATPLQGMGDAYIATPRGGIVRRPMMSAMGDDATAPMPTAYAQFGHQAATALISSVRKLSPANRKTALKKALNSIDKSLWTRTQTITTRYTKQGMPPAQALHAGLARAMSTGLAAEVVHTGMKRQRPGATGLLGLGCYGRSSRPALGDTVASKVGALTSSSTVTASSAPAAAPPTEGQCDTTGAFIWKGGTWVRMSATDVCTSTYGATVVTGTNQGGISGAAAGGAAPAPDPNAQVMQVGPFNIPLNVAGWSVHWQGKMPTDWQAFILPELAHDCSNCIISSMEDATQGHPLGALMDFFDNVPLQVNRDLVGRQMPYVGTGNNGIPVGQVQYVMQDPDQPIVLVKRPDNGDLWGVYMSISPVDPTKPWDSTSNPNTLLLRWEPKPQGVWDWIKIIVGDIVDAVGDALSVVGDLACALLQSPAGIVGGAAAGAAVGGAKGATAGAQGAQIAAGACGGAPAPAPLPLPAANNWLLPVAIFGFGAAALMIMMPKRKKKLKPGTKPTTKAATKKPGGTP